MTNNLKDGIEGIDEFVEYFLDGVDCLVSLDSMDYDGERILRAGAKRELASLIEQEKEKAVREFADWLDGKEKRGYEDTIRLEQAEQFLKESEGQDE